MIKIYNIKSPHFFADEDLPDLISLLNKITIKSQNKIEKKRISIELCNLEITKWSYKVRRLGAIPIACYEVKINTKKGYYHWKFKY